MRAASIALSAAFVVLGASQASAQDLDCRRAAAACAAGFACVQVGDVWDCVPEGPQPEVRAASPSGAFPDGLATDADVDWLYGTWDLDVARTLEAQDMTEEERQMAQAFMSAMEMSITFDASGTMRMEALIFGETQSESGTWTGRREGELIVIDSTTDDGTAPPETSLMRIDFASRDVFAASEVDSEEILYFSRQR
jgi:hypothetical protein